MTIKAIKTTPYGIQLEDNSYLNTTLPVRNFLKGKLPAVLEIVESENKDGRETIAKVKIVSSSQNTAKEYDRSAERVNVDAGNCVQRAMEGYVAGKFLNIMAGTMECVAAFKAAKQELENQDG